VQTGKSLPTPQLEFDCDVVRCDKPSPLKQDVREGLNPVAYTVPAKAKVLGCLQIRLHGVVKNQFADFTGKPCRATLLTDVNNTHVWRRNCKCWRFNIDGGDGDNTISLCGEFSLFDEEGFRKP
jgi:hypothetical protein